MRDNDTVLIEAADRLANALYASRCDCPKERHCECERQKAIDNWEATRNV